MQNIQIVVILHEILQILGKGVNFRDLQKNDNILARKNDNIVDLRVTLN